MLSGHREQERECSTRQEALLPFTMSCQVLARFLRYAVIVRVCISSQRQDVGIRNVTDIYMSYQKESTSTPFHGTEGYNIPHLLNSSSHIVDDASVLLDHLWYIHI